MTFNPMGWVYRPPIVRRLLFVYELVWFCVLVVLAFAYLKSNTLHNWVPAVLRGAPVEVAWFGTLGGVAISLRGIYEHPATDKTGRNLWNEGWPLWYLGRPFSGMLAGIVTYALLKAVYPSGSPTTAVVLAAAFILGTQENRFFAFLAQVGAVIVAVPSKSSGGGSNAGGGGSGGAAGGGADTP